MTSQSDPKPNKGGNPILKAGLVDTLGEWMIERYISTHGDEVEELALEIETEGA